MSEKRPDTEEECIEHMVRCINARDRREAIRVARDYMTLHGVFQTAAAWFRLGLAYILLNKPSEFSGCWDAAKHAKGYNTGMRGDFHRDAAQYQVRRRRFSLAAYHLRYARRYHASDANKLAADQIAMGKLLLAQRNATSAIEVFSDAEQTLATLILNGEKHDEQYLRNARWWRLLALATAGHRYRGAFDDLYESTYGPGPDKTRLVDEPSKYRQKLAMMLRNAGPARSLVARVALHVAT